jgi:electron transport complex protein RnfE
MSTYADISRNGLWKQNPAVAQILGMCPVLAISTSAVNGISLGLATALVMALSNMCSAMLRNFIPYEIRIPVFILIIAALVTAVDLAMNAYLHSLYLVLGIFIPLIVTNCIVLARIEAFAAKNETAPATFDGWMMGIGLTAVLGILGGIREFLGTGQLLSGIEMVIPGTHALQILPQDYPGFLVAILPPGAFITLGFLVAAKNWLDARAAKAAAASPLAVHA